MNIATCITLFAVGVAIAFTYHFACGFFGLKVSRSRALLAETQRDEFARRLNRIIEKDHGQPIAGSLAHAIRIAKGEV